MIATAAVGVFQVCASTGHTLAEGFERAGYFTHNRYAIGASRDFSLALFVMFWAIWVACFRGISPGSDRLCGLLRHRFDGSTHSPVAMSTGRASMDSPQHTAIDAPWRRERAWEQP